MLNKKVKEVLKIVLPALFITYASCITFFTHTHIVNGVTIVHSHPYSSDDSGKPNHEHSGLEIQLIQTLSTFFVAGPIILIILISLPDRRKTILQIRYNLSIPSFKVEGISRLRPPPVL